MSTTLHVFDVGQGSMVLIVMDDGTTLLCDCNVTADNEDRVMAKLSQIMSRPWIDYFLNTHRDADHLRGLNTIHTAHPIGAVVDNGRPSGSPECAEYEDYMRLRRRVRSAVLPTRWTEIRGDTRLLGLHGAHSSGPADCNRHCVVLKVESVAGGCSVLLAGDCDAVVWRDQIMPSFEHTLSSSVLIAGHHGGLDFFDARPPFVRALGVPADRYVEHLRAILPYVTVISVGNNNYGHPDFEALAYYERFSLGSPLGDSRRVWTTETRGHMRVDLYASGAWWITSEASGFLPVRRRLAAPRSVTAPAFSSW
jgi:beta-lactamase superfamily II metal-dependent hydrolase